jgi:hypothetical protein
VFGLKPKTIQVLVPNRGCPACGPGHGFNSSRFEDLVYCRDCGAAYYIGSEVIEPVAHWEPETFK